MKEILKRADSLWSLISCILTGIMDLKKSIRYLEYMYILHELCVHPTCVVYILHELYVHPTCVVSILHELCVHPTCVVYILHELCMHPT